MGPKEKNYRIGTSTTRRLTIIIAYQMGQGKIFHREEINELAERYGVTESTVYKALREVNETRL